MIVATILLPTGPIPRAVKLIRIHKAWLEVGEAQNEGSLEGSVFCIYFAEPQDANTHC